MHLVRDCIAEVALFLAQACVPDRHLPIRRSRDEHAVRPEGEKTNGHRSRFESQALRPKPGRLPVLRRCGYEVKKRDGTVLGDRGQRLAIRGKRDRVGIALLLEDMAGFLAAGDLPQMQGSVSAGRNQRFAIGRKPEGGDLSAMPQPSRAQACQRLRRQGVAVPINRCWLCRLIGLCWNLSDGDGSGIGSLLLRLGGGKPEDTVPAAQNPSNRTTARACSLDVLMVWRTSFANSTAGRDEALPGSILLYTSSRHSWWFA